MTRTILTLALSLLFPQFTIPAHTGAPNGAASPAVMTIVHSTACGGGLTGSAPLSCTIPATTAGNALVLACDANSTVTWSATPSLTLQLGSGASDLFLGVSGNIAGGLTTATVTPSSLYASLACVVAEVSGLPTTPTTDGTPYGPALGPYGTGNATSYTGSVTTANATDVILGIVVILSHAPTFAAGTGYTLAGQDTYSTTLGVALEFQNVSAKGSYNPGMTWSTGSSNYAGTMALVL